MQKGYAIVYGLLLSVWLLPTAQGQVVNMESRRLHTDSVRRAGEFNFAFLFNSTNNNTLLTFRGNLTMQQKSKNYKHLWLMVANYDLAKAEAENFVNAVVGHLRYNYFINNWLRWECFTQVQTNQPLGINFRWLNGTGPRMKATLGQNAHLYLGTAYMYEQETDIGQPPARLYEHRSSSYFSGSITVPALKGDLVTTLYFQPLFVDISNYRLMNETKMDFSIFQKFRLYTRFNYYFDSRPPAAIRKSAISLEQGFSIRF
jgi:hypothetical protein